jgi:SOS-response transcriptional repressor LexA
MTCCPTCGAKRAHTFGVTRQMMDALQFVADFIEEHQYSPSFDEIQAGVDVRSKSQVHRLIHSLVERNLLKTLPYQSRSTTLTDGGDALVRARKVAA